MSDSERRAVKEAGPSAVRAEDFEKVADSVLDLVAERQAARDEVVERELAEYRTSTDFTEQVAKQLGPEIRASLGQFHDYRALAGRVIRNLSVYLEDRFPGQKVADQLDRAPHEIAAAYWSAVLMIDKFDTAIFLLEPDAITAVEDPPFRFHGLVTKYLKIYQREVESRGLQLIVHGASYGELKGNSKAIGVIPHALLDNAVKYAPAGSHIDVTFEEDAASITLTVESLGPKVQSSEKDRIFEPFYRGKAAKEVSAEGMGFGLGACQLVAHRIGTHVRFWQAPAPEEGRHFRTRFTVEFPKVDT